MGTRLLGERQAWPALAKEGKVETGSGEGLVASCLVHHRSQNPRKGQPVQPLSRESGPSSPGARQMFARNRPWGSQGVNNTGESTCKPHSMEVSPTATSQKATKIFILSSSFQNCSLEGDTDFPTSQTAQPRGTHPTLTPIKPMTH